MPTSCCVHGCVTRYRKGGKISFFRFPKNPQLLSVWVRALRRQNWFPSTSSRLCGKHFQSGKPSNDVNHPDYVPNIFSFNKVNPKNTLKYWKRRQIVVEKRRRAEEARVREAKTKALCESAVEALCENVIKSLGEEVHEKLCKSWTEAAATPESGPEATLRNKWKYLRQQFCMETGLANTLREHKRMKPEEEPKWQYYKVLSFLKDVVKPRKEPNAKRAIAAVDISKPRPNLIQSKKAKLRKSAVVDTDNDMDVKIYPVAGDLFQDVIGDSPRLKRLPTDSDCNETADELADSGVQIYELIQPEQPESDDMLFFKSLMPYVNQIPDHLKLRFRNRVQEVIQEFAFES